MTIAESVASKDPSFPVVPPRRIATATRPTASPPAAADRLVKAFSIKAWSDADQGEKVGVYAESGMGKTTLSSTAPCPYFIGPDDGGRKIKNPITSQDLNYVHGIETFQDIRDALASKSLWPNAAPGESSIVLDNASIMEQLAEQTVYETYKLPSDKARSLRSYGWGEGYFHLQDVMRLLQTDLEPHVRGGRNIIVIFQKSACRIANTSGNDYLQDGPALYHDSRVSIRQDWIRWLDHLVKIDLRDALNPSTVVDSKGKAKAGKVQANATDAKAIYTGGAAHFVAKSRPVKRNRSEPYRIPICIPFESPADTSLWDYVFGGCEAAE